MVEVFYAKINNFKVKGKLQTVHIRALDTCNEGMAVMKWSLSGIKDVSMN